MSWLSKYVLDPLEKDLAGFFGAGSSASKQVQTSTAAIGSTALAQVDPVLTVAETALEGAIDAALTSLGAIGVIAEAGVDVTYPLLAGALNNVIAQKLNIPAAAPPGGT